jgi:hypothetical protein
MPRNVVIVSQDEKPWMEGQAPWLGKSASGAPTVIYKPLIEEGDVCPRAQFVRYEPGHREGRHSHPTGEFLYITKGDVDLDGTRVGAGTLIFIDKHTVYGPLTAGADGTEFLRVEVA